MPAFLSPELAPRSRGTLSELIDRVRGDLGLRDNAYVTDTDITFWLNEGQSEIAREAQWFRTATTAGTTSGTKEYELPGPSSGRCIAIEEIWLDGVQLYPIALDTLALGQPDYLDQGNGTPYFYYLRGSTGFDLHPTPGSTALANLTLVYVGEPPHISAPGDTFYVPATGQAALIDYACLRASLKDAHGEGGKRVAHYERAWERRLKQICDQASSAGDRDLVVVGEQSILADGTSGYPRVPWTSIVASG